MIRKLLGLCVAIVSAVACGTPDTATAVEDIRFRGRGDDDRGDARGLPAELARALRGDRDIDDALLDRIVRVEHDVTLEPGRRIHVRETFTLRAWLRWPHRAMLLIPGPVTNARYYDIDVPGYDSGAMLARRGFFAFAADLEGAGDSSMPVDGRTAILGRQVENMRAVLQYVRRTRLVAHVDVLGESWGGGVAAELCADAGLTRSCVLASMIYRTGSDLARATFLNPGFRGFLDSIPDGYLPTFPGFYMPFVSASEPAVQDFTFATQPGRYALAPEYAVFELPFFDPTRARVPGLVVQGELDPNQPRSDTEQLAREYGRHGARLTLIASAGHVPRVEAPPASTDFWRAVTSFVDP